MTLVAQAIAAVLTAVQAPATTQDGPLTMDQAIAIAERNAFAIAIQQTQVERNRQQVAQAQANLGPRVAGTATYSRNDRAVTQSFGPGTPPVVVQPIDSKSLGASVSLPIDISGNLQRLVRASRSNERAARFTLQAVYNDTRLNVRTAYLNVLRAQGLVGVQEQALRDAQERLEQARRQFAGDQVARIDVTRFETQVAQATSDLIAARNNLQLSQNAFNATLARPIETPVNLVDIAALPPVSAVDSLLVTSAQVRRPEVQALGSTRDALANLRRAQESGMNPSLAFGLNYNRNLEPQGQARASATTGTLSLSIPIFDSGLTRARVREARQNEEQARIQLDQLQLGISQEVRGALTNLSNAQARLTNAVQQVRLAEEVYRIARVRRDAGEGTYVEIIDAETQLTVARNNLVTARYDYLTAYSQLQRAVGQDDIAAAATPVSPAPAPRTPATNGGGTR
jgi:outer membrane protein TolC